MLSEIQARKLKDLFSKYREIQGLISSALMQREKKISLVI